MRSTPFELVFDALAEDPFPRIRTALATAAIDPTDRDAFLMLPEVLSLIREIRPDDGVGEGIDQLVALVHHAYLTWDSGRWTWAISEEQLTELLTPIPPILPGSVDAPRAYYAQFPERRIWAELIDGQAPEPMDGCFVYTATNDTELRTLGIFGLRPDRAGFSVVESFGTRPEGLIRPDGTSPYASVLAGGSEAGLHSVISAEELLELGWRTRGLAAEAATQARG
jgi:hypothetical protein